MRCPRCQDHFEADLDTCPVCGVGLVADDDPTVDPLPVVADARLGTFHPVMAVAVLGLLNRRGVVHRAEPDDTRVRIVVDRTLRDDLRTELTLNWSELVRALPEDDANTVTAAGGSPPGWYDPPRGGHVDRTGRLVVDAAEDHDDDAARVIGPGLLALGAILAVVGWFVLDSSAITLAGAALALFGLLVPR